MATRSFICMKVSEDKYDGVYCHFDGYPKGVGAVLRSSYNTQEKVSKLIDQGSISFLKETIEESRFYHTWRNETLQIYRNLLASEAIDLAREVGGEYMYIFEKAKWTWIKL